MKKLYIAYATDIVAMILWTAITLNLDSSQPFIIGIGILAGIGFFISAEIMTKKKKE